MLNQYFHPDIAATAQLASDLGADLARRGHEVTAVASRRSYVGGDRLPDEEVHQGVKIRRVRATALGRANHLVRSVDYSTYLAGALWPVIADARPDVIVALSTPPLIAALGLLAKSLRRTRLVYWVMDVYPQVAVHLGVLPEDSLAARGLGWLSRLLYARADAVVALDEAMKARLVAAGAQPERIEVIDNWCDGDEIRPLEPASNPLRRELGLGDAFTVSYSGNLGLGHDFETITGAMERLAGENVHWLFIGDGPRRPALEAEVAARGLHRVTFLSPRPRAELPVSLTAAHASLVSLQPGLAGLLVPSKLYGILAAGVPVVYVGPPEGRVAGVIRDHGVGIAVDNGDADGLARGLLALRDGATGRAEMGRRARALFDGHFARARSIERHHQLLLKVAQC